MNEIYYYVSCLVYYISYLIFVFYIFLIINAIKSWNKIKINKKKIFKLIIINIVILSFIYARFVELNIITVKTTKIQVGFQAKVAVISDTHIGIFNNSLLLEKAVNRINKIDDIDFVLIPGDITFYNFGDLTKMLSPLKKLKYPTFAVLGNHDTGHPGPQIQKQLQIALQNNGVILLNNSSYLMTEKNIHILGLGDKLAKNDNVSILDRFCVNDNLLVLTHNPDTIMKYKNDIADLTISGHTHGGQFQIPFIYNGGLLEKYHFNDGLYNTKKGKLFISTGIGSVGIPIRLLVPPRVDIIEMK